MKILVTGGSGFLGRNLTEELADDHVVLAPGIGDLNLLEEDNVRDYLSENKVDTIIHCAVKPGHRNMSDLSGQLYSNTRMFFNLVRNQDKFKHMFYIGSGSAYGVEHELKKVRESFFDTYVPTEEGGFSKYIISKYIEKVDYITELRVFGIFGKFEEYAIRFISNLICKTLYDLPLTMKQNRRFDYIYIKDFCKIVRHFIGNIPKEKAIHITPDKSVELKTLAKLIKKITGSNQKLIVAKKGFGLEYTGDNSILRKLMPNFQFMSFEESINDLYSWYLEHKKDIDKSKLLVDK